MLVWTEDTKRRKMIVVFIGEVGYMCALVRMGVSKDAIILLLFDYALIYKGFDTIKIVIYTFF